MINTALILAAGMGSRLQPVTGSVPKPLLRIAGVPLLKRIILTAKKAGIERFVIVTGYAADQIHDTFDQDEQLAGLIEWIHNEEWSQPNGGSVLCARPVLSGPFAMLMADHLFEEQTLARLLQQPPAEGECVLAVDKNIRDVYDIADATKVFVEENQVREIDKTLFPYNAIDTGMFLCTTALFEALEACRGPEGCSLSDGVRLLAKQGRMRAFDIEDAFWQDVDTPEMLAYAERVLLSRLRKPTDGWVSRNLNRPVSTRISGWLTRTPITPNQVTFVTFLTGLAGAWILANGDYRSVLLGAGLFQLSSILDGCDGEIAKLKFRESKYGSWLDTITDNLTYVAFFCGVLSGYSRFNDAPYIWPIGAGAVLAVVLSILLMYYYLASTGESGSLVRYNEAFQRRMDRPQPGLAARTLNALRLMSKRDFFTLVFLTLAVFGRLDWMFWAVIIGGYVGASAVFVFTGRLLSQSRHVGAVSVNAEPHGKVASGV